MEDAGDQARLSDLTEEYVQVVGESREVLFVADAYIYIYIYYIYIYIYIRRRKGSIRGRNKEQPSHHIDKHTLLLCYSFYDVHGGTIS